MPSRESRAKGNGTFGYTYGVQITDDPIVFKLPDLVSLYKQRLEQFGIGSSESDTYATRLNEKLLAKISELEAHKRGRDILLAF